MKKYDKASNRKCMNEKENKIKKKKQKKIRQAQEPMPSFIEDKHWQKRHETG